MAVLETNGDGSPLRQSGLYRHRETGQTTVLTQTPGLGSPMIDAFVRAGFERVGDVPTPGTVISEPKIESKKK